MFHILRENGAATRGAQENNASEFHIDSKKKRLLVKLETRKHVSFYEPRPDVANAPNFNVQYMHFAIGVVATNMMIHERKE